MEYPTADEGGVVAEPSRPDIPRLIREYRDEYPNGILKLRQLDKLDELIQALAPEQLTPDTAGNLYLLATDTYGDPGWQRVFKKMLSERDGREALTSSLHHLLYGQGEVEERLDQHIADDGPRRIWGVREAIMVKALAVTYPQRWVPWFLVKGESHKSGLRRGKLTFLRLLGIDPPAGRLTRGQRAAETNDLLKNTLLQAGFPDQPWEMQDFTWWLAERHLQQARTS
jgi:hypothetical protein